MKIGPPINDVKIPIGNSDGATILLLMVSAIKSKILPKTADRGKMNV